MRVRGHYDDVNRLCAQLAGRFAWGIVNVNLRGYYAEGSKTLAFEIAEQLGWRLPTAVIGPMAGGSVVTKLHKGFGEFVDAASCPVLGRESMDVRRPAAPRSFASSSAVAIASFPRRRRRSLVRSRSAIPPMACSRRARFANRAVGRRR